MRGQDEQEQESDAEPSQSRAMPLCAASRTKRPLATGKANPAAACCLNYAALSLHLDRPLSLDRVQGTGTVKTQNAE
jgi:hypothetical protein